MRSRKNLVMPNQKVIRLEKDGPFGTPLQKLVLDPQDFQSDLPEQFWHIYHQNGSLNLSVGVWTTTSMQEKFGPYPGDEFMFILEGQVEMIDSGGRSTLIGEGQSFCVRNGIPVSWRQNGFLRKFFITYNPPGDVVPNDPSDEPGVFVLDSKVLSSGLENMETYFPFDVEGKHPEQQNATLFVNDTGNMTVGRRETPSLVTVMQSFPCNEMIKILDGEIAIKEKAGRSHEFLAGDVFFVPKGTECSWEFRRISNVIYCRVDED